MRVNWRRSVRVTGYYYHQKKKKKKRKEMTTKPDDNVLTKARAYLIALVARGTNFAAVETKMNDHYTSVRIYEGAVDNAARDVASKKAALDNATKNGASLSQAKNAYDTAVSRLTAETTSLNKSKKAIEDLRYARDAQVNIAELGLKGALAKYSPATPTPTTAQGWEGERARAASAESTLNATIAEFIRSNTQPTISDILLSSKEILALLLPNSPPTAVLSAAVTESRTIVASVLTAAVRKAVAEKNDAVQKAAEKAAAEKAAAEKAAAEKAAAEKAAADAQALTDAIKIENWTAVLGRLKSDATVRIDHAQLIINASLPAQQEGGVLAELKAKIHTAIPTLTQTNGADVQRALDVCAKVYARTSSSIISVWSTTLDITTLLVEAPRSMVSQQLQHLSQSVFGNATKINVDPVTTMPTGREVRLGDVVVRELLLLAAEVAQSGFTIDKVSSVQSILFDPYLTPAEGSILGGTVWRGTFRIARRGVSGVRITVTCPKVRILITLTG